MTTSSAASNENTMKMTFLSQYIREELCTGLRHRYGAPWIILNVNTSPRGQNGRHFADDMLRCIFVNEKFSILIKIWLRFVPKGPIKGRSAVKFR